jgi:hypothetical protein
MLGDPTGPDTVDQISEAAIPMHRLSGLWKRSNPLEAEHQGRESQLGRFRQYLSRRPLRPIGRCTAKSTQNAVGSRPDGWRTNTGRLGPPDRPLARSLSGGFSGMRLNPDW